MRSPKRLGAGSVVVLVAAVTMLAAAPAQAARARHVTIEIDESFVDDFLTETCGVEVVVSFEATVNVTLLYNGDGLLVREIDPGGGGMVTFSSATGASFSMPFNNTIIDYGEGAMVGSAFTASFAGLIGHVPGHIASDAGLAVVSGTVTGFDELGIPLLEFTDLVVRHGNAEDGDDVLAALCSALAG